MKLTKKQIKDREVAARLSAERAANYGAKK